MFISLHAATCYIYILIGLNAIKRISDLDLAYLHKRSPFLAEQKTKK